MTLNDSETSSFGFVLRQKRLLKGLTQDQLVLRAGNVCSKAFISQLENNRHQRSDGEPMQPDVEIVDALADALGEPRNYFRRLTGHRLIEDEPVDEIAEEFAVALHRYKLLEEADKDFVQQQVRSVIDHLLERSGHAEMEPTPKQAIRRKDPRTTAGMTIAQAKARAAKDAVKKKEKKASGL